MISPALKTKRLQIRDIKWVRVLTKDSQGTWSSRFKRSPSDPQAHGPPGKEEPLTEFGWELILGEAHVTFEAQREEKCPSLTQRLWLSG